IEGADHSFGVLKRSGRDVDEVMDELAGTVAAWGEGVLG
nr:alpha/beta hydrolase [Pseudomonadales bacterium]NIX06809.1 alpha/beta hydrolase [Pseudomonadales bacterium]